MSESSLNDTETLKPLTYLSKSSTTSQESVIADSDFGNTDNQEDFGLDGARRVQYWEMVMIAFR